MTTSILLSRLKTEEKLNKEIFINQLFDLSTDALKSLVMDVKAQVDAGLMSRKEAHDRTNCISAVLMTKEVESMMENKNAIA